MRRAVATFLSPARAAAWVTGLSLGAFSLSLLPRSVLAQGELGLDYARDIGLPGSGARGETPVLPALILQIVNVVLVIVAVLALAFLVYGGFRYIQSRGNEQEVEASKGIIGYAVIGLVVIGVAAALVNFVVDALLPRAR